jgi:hypothetical protein
MLQASVLLSLLEDSIVQKTRTQTKSVQKVPSIQIKPFTEITKLCLPKESAIFFIGS